VRLRRKFAATATTAATLLVVSARPASAFPGDGYVANIASRGMSAAFDATAQGMVVWVLDGVATFVNGVVNFLKTAARPEVDSVWFSGPTSPYASVRSIALTMLLVFVFLGIIDGLVKGDVEGMVRRVLGGLPTALFGMVATTFVVARLLDLTDALSTAVLERSGSDAMDFLTSFGAQAAFASSPGFATLVLGVVAVITAFLLWVELLIRSALVYFLVALSPLAFAATLWPAARGILRRLVELLLAVVLSKFVICVALSIGAAALGGTSQSAPPDAGIGDAAAMGLGTLLSGTVLLALACWSPFLLMRLLPIVEGAVVAQGVSRGPMRSAQTTMSRASYATSVGRIAGVGTQAGKAAGGSSGARAGGSSRIAGSKAPTFVRKPEEKKS
jgi:type IV secretion system protein TrbL